MDRLTEIERLIKEAEEEAYRRGWEDALAAVRRAVERDVKPRDLHEDMPNEVIERARRTREKRSLSVIQMVHGTVREFPGLTGVEIVKRFEKSGLMVNERTVRTALRRLRLAEKIEQKDERWYATPQESGG